MFTRLLLIFGFILFYTTLSAQNYTSIANGSWTSASVWTNTSGWGGATPPLSNQGSGTITINHDVTITGTYSTGSATINVSAGKTLRVTGNATLAGGGTINVSGILILTGNATLNSNLNVLPGGAVYVMNALTVNSAQYLTVGTNATAPPYADLVVYGNVKSQSSGDILINRNGRFATFGNIEASGGGTIITIANGGQAYVDGNIQMSGGGSQIINNNSASPYGLYVDGQITNSGGGSSTTGNTANTATMNATNVPFANWVNSVSSGPLPVELLFFRGEQKGEILVFTWATATERDADFFVIEKSGNGAVFFPLDTIDAHGNSSVVQRYTWIEDAPVIGRNYYRLKEVDFDGNYEYFKVIFAEYSNSPKLNLYPTIVNPGEDIFLDLNFTPEQKVHAAILNLEGRQMISVEFADTRRHFNLDLDPGIYVLKVNVQDQTFLQRFVVR